MKVTKVTDTVNTLTRVEYDINVWSDDEGFVYLTFYPLRYPGDDNYPDDDLGHGLPLINTSQYYSLQIPVDARGPRSRKALKFLERMVDSDHETMPETFPAPLWDTEGHMDWWATETELVYGPELITDFMAKLPRRAD